MEGISLRIKVALLAAAFAFGILGGMASAFWTDTGDDYYWTDTTSEGIGYCAAINTATNTNDPNPEIVQGISDAKAKWDVFCAGQVISPANVHHSANIIESGSATLCRGTGWVGNAAGTYLARSWQYLHTELPQTPAGCGSGQYFKTHGGSSVLAMGSTRVGANSTGWIWMDPA